MIPAWLGPLLTVWLCGIPVAALTVAVAIAYVRGKARSAGAVDDRRPSPARRAYGAFLCVMWPVLVVTILGTYLFDAAVIAFARWHGWRRDRARRAAQAATAPEVSP